MFSAENKERKKAKQGRPCVLTQKKNEQYGGIEGI
jgi:hypothetical protein